MTTDQATFRVLSNQALLALAARAPASLQELGETEGVGQWVVERRGRELLAAVRAGVAVPETDLPRFPPSRRWERDPESELRAETLRQVCTRVAEKLDLDPGFLMSRAVLDEVARRNPRSAEELLQVPEIRRWQVEAIGEELVKALK